MKTYKTLLNIALNCYLFFTGLLIIIGFLYLRLYLKKSQYDLVTIKENLTIEIIIIGLFFIILQLYFLGNTFYVIIRQFFIKETKTFVIFKKYVQLVLNKLYIEPLQYILELVAPKIPYTGTFIVFYVNFYKKHTEFFMKLIAFIFNFLPRIVLAFVFFIEIIFFNHIFYFIKICYIIFIPILYKIFINLCDIFYKNNIDDVIEYLAVTNKGKPNINGAYTAFDIQFKPEYAHYDTETLLEFIDSWYLLFYLLNFTEIIKNYINALTPYITIFTSILYTTAGLYKVLYLLDFL